MKKWLATIAITCLGISLAFANPQNAADQVKENINQVLTIISKNNGSNTAQVRKQAENYAIPYFDFQRMTALAVGAQWKNASPVQKTALANEFRTLLIRTYSGTMMQYKNATVSFKGTPRTSGKSYIVSSEVKINSGKPVSMDYTVYQNGNKYLVYNVSVEGASLVTVYRNQFNDTISKNGIDGLVNELKNKNSKGL